MMITYNSDTETQKAETIIDENDRKTPSLCFKDKN